MYIHIAKKYKVEASYELNPDGYTKWSSKGSLVGTNCIVGFTLTVTWALPSKIVLIMKHIADLTVLNFGLQEFLVVLLKFDKFSDTS